MYGYGPRTVIRDHAFEQAARGLHPDIKRCDEVLVGVEWAVASYAEKHPQIPGTTLRLIKTDALGDTPPLRIYFTIDDDETCTLRYIEKVEASVTDVEDLADLEDLPF